MLARLNRIRKATTSINVFSGLNKRNTGFSRISGNSGGIYTEFRDMQNMGSDKYPLLAPRGKRCRVCFDNSEIKSNILTVNGGFIYIDGEGKLNLCGEKYEIKGVDGTKEHEIVLYGANVVILPEGLLISINNASDKQTDINNRDCEAINYCGQRLTDYFDDVFVCSIRRASIVDDEIISPDYTVYYSDFNFAETEIQSSEPAEYEKFWSLVTKGDVIEHKGSFYRCTSHKLKTRSGGTYAVNGFMKLFNSFNYTEIKANGISNNLSVGDYVKVELSGNNIIMLDKNWGGIEDSYVTDKFYYQLNGKVYRVCAKSENSIVINCKLENSVAYTGTVSVIKSIPEINAPEIDSGKIIECNNRLWACSSKANEIYACKQGDCTSWFEYSNGISTDSFAMTVGCEGEFTGIAKQNDSVIFFKENWVLKIYGTKPSNYTLATYNVLGVEKGSSKSIVWINGVLYYLSKCGVCQYSPGSQPVVISENAFGYKKYKYGVAQRHDNKYFISAENEDGQYELFVYDTDNGLWHKEDNTRIVSATSYNNTMYYIDGATGYMMCPDDKHNLLIGKDNFESEGEFEWYGETGDLYDGDFNTKYISKIKIGINPEKGAQIRLLAQTEDNGIWRELSKVSCFEKKPGIIPVTVRRAEYLRLRLEGKGQLEIYGIDIEYSQGSDKR